MCFRTLSCTKKCPFPILFRSSLVAQMVKNHLQCRRFGFNPWVWWSPGGGHGNPLQYSCLENPRGWRSLAGYSPWGHKESDMTEWLSTILFTTFILLIKQLCPLEKIPCLQLKFDSSSHIFVMICINYSDVTERQITFISFTDKQVCVSEYLGERELKQCV